MSLKATLQLFFATKMAVVSLASGRTATWSPEHGANQTNRPCSHGMRHASKSSDTACIRCFTTKLTHAKPCALTSRLTVPACEPSEGEGSQQGSSSNLEGAGAGAEAGRPGSSESTTEGKRGLGRSHSGVVGQVEGPLQLSSAAQAWKDGLGDVDVGKWDLIYRCAPYACPYFGSCYCALHCCKAGFRTCSMIPQQKVAVWHHWLLPGMPCIMFMFDLVALG